MTVKQYFDINDYLKENLLFLEKEEAVNNLLIGIPFSLKDKKELNPFPVLLSVLDDEEIIFSCVQTPPRHLLIYGLEKKGEQSIELLIDFILKSSINFSGLVGPKKIATLFAEKWCAKNNADWKVRFEQLIYQLDAINKIKYSDGVFRKAELEDLEIIKKWFYAFAKEAMNEEDREGNYLAAKNKIEEGGLFIWENNGTVVSMAAASRPTQNSITINYVYTPAEFRGYGYATSCVAKLSEFMLKKYRFCTLFTDQANPTSNGIYFKIGYRPIEEFRMISFIEETF